MPFQAIILDEAHKISSPKAKITKAIYRLKTIHKFALSGSPLLNRPNDIWTIISWIDQNALGSYWGFINRYCVKNYWGSIASYKNLPELKSRIQPLMIRRLRSEVLPQLPEKIETDIVFELTTKEQQLYDKIRKELLFEIEQRLINKVDNPVMIQNSVVKLIRLRQLCNSSRLLGEGVDPDINSSKLEALKEILESLNSEKIVIFSEFSQMCDILEAELSAYQPLKITGDVPGGQRDIILSRFKTDSRYRILISSSAGQYGLNLPEANVLIHYDLPFSIAKILQRVGRVYRLGQQKTTLIYTLLAKGTVDFHVRKLLKKKQEVSAFLLDDLREII